MSRRTPALARLVLLALALTGLVRADMTTGSAFQAGKDAAAGGSAATGSINGTGAAGNVPGYTTNPDAGSFWANGKASLTGNGLGKQAGCTTSSTSGFGGQECNAINFLGGSRPGYPLEKNDALFNLSNGITKDNRDKVAGLDGGTGTGGCTTVEVKDPDLQSTGHCEEWLDVQNNLCTMGQVVKVDADANYQCDQTLNAYDVQSCHRKANVAVVPGCANDTDLLLSVSDPCPSCVDYLVTLLRCDSTSNRYVARFGSRLKSGSGCYKMYGDGVWDASHEACWIDGGQQSVAVSPGQSASGITMVNRNDGSYCFSETGDFACNSTSCNVNMTFHNPCQGTSSNLGNPSFNLPYKRGGITWDNGCSALEGRSK